MYGKKVTCKGTNCTITYTNIKSNDWKRIKHIANMMSLADVGPTLISVNNTTHTLITERIRMPQNPDEEMDLDMVKETTSRFHRLGLIHGDLNFANMGLRDDGTVIIIDYDWIHIANHPPNGFMTFIKDTYDDISSYDEYLVYELTDMGWA